MEYDFLLPQCGNTEKEGISNYHNINFQPIKTFQNISCNHNGTNELIGKRNFTCEQPIVFDPRPIMTGLCVNEEKQREQLQPASTEDYINEKNISCVHPFCPGKMDAKRYFLNIDVESRLKNIDYYTTECKEHVYKLDANCPDCSLSCFKELKKDTNVPYPERPRIECVETQQFPYISEDKENSNIFIRDQQDTVYDFTKHNICNIDSERVWNNPTKRSMKDYECDN